MILQKIIAWNCRGAGSSCAMRHLFLLLRKHCPDILILLETRFSSATLESILPKSRMDSFVVSEAVGFVGGIWVLWNSSVVRLDLVATEDQVLTLFVHQTRRSPWALSAVYASPNWVYREELWQYLTRLWEVMTIPWLVLGDFNQVMHAS